MTSKKITFVIPVYNEVKNIKNTVHSINDAFQHITGYSHDIILVDDGSSDSSLESIKKIQSDNTNISFISFSRNFGKEAAISAGIIKANGDAIICIDADGQHPVSLIPTLIDRWEKGNLVVVGVRISNSREGFVKKYGSKLFYKILSVINESDTVPGSTDYRLIDKKVVVEFKKLTERNRITRGLIDWLGFKRDYVEFEALPRMHGSAGYSFRKLFRLAMHSFVAQSTRPLKLTGMLGLVATILSTFIGIVLGVEMLLMGDPLNLNITGTAFLGVGATFLIGIVLICQGLLALYIESIHTETQNRPLYIIAEES